MLIEAIESFLSMTSLLIDNSTSTLFPARETFSTLPTDTPDNLTSLPVLNSPTDSK